MKVTVHTFAVLKDYFEPMFEVELPDGSDIIGLTGRLQNQCPEAEKSLSSSRVAIDEAIVSPERKLIDNEHIYYIPPSSGG